MRGLGVETGRPISDVLVDIGRNTQDLLRSEIQLAQSEVRDRVLEAWPAGVMFAVGAAAALLGALFLLLGLLFALRLLMPAWAAAGCIAAALTVTATICLNAGVRRFRASPPLFKSRDGSNERAEENAHGPNDQRPDRESHPEHA
jgi:Putative Actinobacterial Holin-X, holin superfamily III